MEALNAKAAAAGATTVLTTEEAAVAVAPHLAAAEVARGAVSPHHTGHMPAGLAC
jgi:hypothetical protein